MVLFSDFHAQGAPPFKWVNGTVATFTFQQGNFNVVGIKSAQGTRFVRFCRSTDGKDIDLTANNVQYDLLKTAYMKDSSVLVGVYDFGKDPQSGIERLCINRVIL
jgi:hypothetical protein